MSKSPSFKDMLMKNAVILNPVLVQLIGLSPVIAASTTLKSAVTLSVIARLELIAVCVIASALLKKLPVWLRVALYFVIGLVLVCPVLWYVESRTLTTLSLGMKIFIPLIAINSVVAVRCEQFAVKNDVKSAFADAVSSGIGASVVFIIAGAAREILGNGTIGGINLNTPVQFKGMLLPFGCLVLLGFMAAALNTFIAGKYSSEADESAPEEEKAAETEPEEVQIQQSIPAEVEIIEAEKGTPAEDDMKIRTEEEINEFFKSLGIELGEKEDE